MRRESWLKLAVLTLPPLALSLLLALELGSNHTLRPNRVPASSGDGPTIAKLEIDPAKVVTSSAASSGNAQLKSSSEPAVASGTRLVAILDNECVNERAERRAFTTLKAAPLTLSELAYSVSEKDEVEDLDYQAYAFDLPQTMTMATLEAEAEADECLRHLTDEKVLKLSAFSFNDPSASAQAHLTSLKLAQAWPLLFNSGLAIKKDVVIAVVDSGVDQTHEDLAANLWRDANGKNGYDFVNGDTDPQDDLGHGTHVAGLIAAVAGNAKGVVGVMGAHAKIMAVKIIGSNDEGTMSDFINGVRYAVDHGADVINLSLGSPDTTAAERDVIQYAINHGCVVVTAAGNDNKQMTATDNDYPSGYAASVPGMLSVGSIDSETGAKSSFSNYSPTFIQIAAPGAESSTLSKGLLSTMPSSMYKRMMGTSMAAPLVSGAAALVVGMIKSQGLEVSNADVVRVIQLSARRDANLASSVKNGAVLDLERLARAVKYRYMVDGDAGTEEAN